VRTQPAAACPGLLSPTPTIRDVRVLNRSYELFGGVSDISLSPANDNIVTGLLTRLARMTEILE